MKQGDKACRAKWGGLLGSLVLLSLLLAACMSFTVFAEDSRDVITVRFLDAYAQSTGQNEITVAAGQSIKLPQAPADRNAPSGTIYGSPSWKPVTGKTDSYLRPSASLTYAQAKTLCSAYGSGSTLNLYATRVLYLTYYNNDGTKKYSQKCYYEGTGSATVSGSPNQKNPAYKGWTTVKGGNAVTAAFGQKVQMKEDLNLYLVTYARLRLYGRDGKRIYYTGYYKPGSDLTIPTVPTLTHYRPLGWGKKKYTSQVSFAPGSKVKITGDLDIYAVYVYQPYTVKFTDSSGKNVSNAYKKLYVRAAAGEYITMPSPPAVKNYVALGWSYTRNDTSARIKAGKKVKISKNITFYAVYRKARTLNIYFVDQDGSTASAFSSLNRTVTEGAAFTLPAVPSKAGYKFTCWRLKVNGNIRCYDPGSKITVYGNYRFYAYYKQLTQVVLHYNDGKDWTTVKLGRGDSFTFPSMINPAGYTFMGWSTKKGILLSPANPLKSCYQAGTSIKIYGQKHFYAVLMRRSEEHNPSTEQLSGISSPDTTAYKGIIFLGDSRTERLMRTLKCQNINYSKKNVSFVCKGGVGIWWLKDKGYQQLLSVLENMDSNDKRPVALVFNFGVNDLGNSDEYIAFFKSIAPTLKAKNCRLYIMSVNPVNNAILKNLGKVARNECDLISFNAKLRSSLAGQYTYIDTYSWLMMTGYSTDNGASGSDSGEDDGLHYTVKTYERIYLKCLQYLAGQCN